MGNQMQGDNSVFAAKNVIVAGDELWMLSNNTDVLLHFDFKNLKLLDYHIIPGKKLMQYAHLALSKIENMIYIAPYMESSLVYFDCMSGEMGNIDIPYESDDAKKKDKFNIVVAWNSYLVLIGHTVRGIFYYDTLSGHFTRDVTYLEDLKKGGCDINDVLFSDSYYQRENRIYIPIYASPVILEIDLETRLNTIHKLYDEKEIRLRTIDGCSQGGKGRFLLTTTNDESLIWSPVDGIEERKAFGFLRGEEKIYMRAFHVRGKNYYFSAYERKVFVETEERIQELEFEYESKGGVEEAAGKTQFEAIFKSGFDIYFQARSNGQMFKIDTSSDTIYRMDFDVELDKRKEIINRVFASRRVIDMLTESSWFGLESFLEKYVLYRGGEDKE